MDKSRLDGRVEQHGARRIPARGNREVTARVRVGELFTLVTLNSAASRYASRKWPSQRVVLAGSNFIVLKDTDRESFVRIKISSIGNMS